MRLNKFFKSFLVVLLTIALSFVMVNAKSSVFADTITNNKGQTIEYMGSYTNGDATYVKASETEHLTLEFGLKYVHDKGYVSTNNSADIKGYAAGGSAYSSSGEFKTNTFYGNEIRFLDIDPSLGIEVIPWSKFSNGKWTLNTVTAMAKDFEELNSGYKVIGAVNCDFFDINSTYNYNYTTTGTNVCNGEFYKVSTNRKAVGFKDGTLIGDIYPTKSEKPVLEIFNDKKEVIYSIDVDKINKEPESNEVSAWFAFYDTDHKPIEQSISDAYIIAGDRLVPFNETTVYGNGNVLKYGEGVLNKSTFAIKTNNSEVKEKLTNGTYIRVQYTITGELAGYDNIVGAGDTVLMNGECVAPADYRHPRTFIGAREDGSIILMEVDGRQANIDCYGVTLKEEAAVMKYYGATCAFNVDGGGSSTICILQDGEFKIMNTPSDGHARSDSNCLLVVVKVPVLELKASEIKTDSFKFTVDVIEMMEQYKDLYISFGDEENKQKVVSGKVFTVDKLDSNTKYNYFIFAKIGDVYYKMPYSGIVQTAKLKYVIEDFVIDRKLKGSDYFYDISYNFTDVDTTKINMVLIINGKRYYANKDHFEVPMDAISPLSSSANLEITYNVGDDKGAQTDYVKIAGQINNAEIVFATSLGEVNYLMNNLYN